MRGRTSPPLILLTELSITRVLSDDSDMDAGFWAPDREIKGLIKFKQLGNDVTCTIIFCT